jgi:CPA2 family monovalent cation:H+ antiporter-2
MGIPLLQDITIIFGLSIIVLLVSHQLRLPTVVGFLLTGIFVGPHGLRLIKGLHEVEILADIGVVLLLFAIGLEFSFRELSRLKKAVLLGGSLQVALTVLATFGIVLELGEVPSKAIFIGFLVALSSTAIVLKVFQEKAEVETPHGRTALAILIFQDIIVVLMMLISPILSGTKGSISTSLFVLLLKGIAIIGLVILSARYIVPHALYQVARTRSRELFLLSICAMGLTVAWLTSIIGLSLGLGAFLAGLIISESEYSLAALGGIRPFRDVFMSFFFVSIGMLLDVSFVFQNTALIGLLALSVIALKTFIVFLVSWILALQLRTAILVSLSLSQIGEFSFVLSRTGVEYGLLGKEMYQLFLSVSVLTMATAPLMIALAPRLADFAVKLPMLAKLRTGFAKVPVTSNRIGGNRLRDHVIIIGFGANGRLLAQAAKAASISYVIIEMNADTVRNERAKGEPILYGDATQEALLEHVSIKEARVVVIAVYDPVATRHIVQLARELNPKVHVIARTRFISEVESLYALGADEIIPAEFETAVEIFVRVLIQYLIPQNEIERFVAEVRADGYKMFRALSKPSACVSDLKSYLSDVEVKTFRIEEKSSIIGQSLTEIGLRQKHGVTLVAIRRNEQTLSNPDSSTKLCANDLIVLLGTPEKMAQVGNLFKTLAEVLQNNRMK